MAVYDNPYPWNLHSVTGDAVDFTFRVPGVPAWDRPEESRVAQAPCGGPPTVLTTTGALPPRRFRVDVRFPPGSTRNTDMALLETLWVARGPYTLTAPIFPNTFPVVFDPSQGGLHWVVGEDGSRTATVGFQEIA